MSLGLFLKDEETMSRMRQCSFGSYLDDFARQLSERGYSHETACLHLRLIVDFARWLKRNRVSNGELSLEHVTRYVRCRQRRMAATGCDESALRHFVQFLRGCGEPARKRTSRRQESCELAIDEYVGYLIQEKALSPTTITYYKEFASSFLAYRFGDSRIDFTLLRGADILGFVQERARNANGGKRAKLMVTALRSFFRYLRYKGAIDSDLAAVIPSVAQWSKASLPKSIPPDQVELLISSRTGRMPVQRRDYAIFLLLARLGLRAGEVVGLKLDDIDWRAGCILVTGKGRVVTKMPLPAEVGEAIAAYLLEARPSSKSRSVFLTVRAPITSMSVAGLSTRVGWALAALGIKSPTRGTHLFRHSLATNMLRGGHSLAEIGELLRHRSTQTTEIYAKVDLPSLRQLALPWPGGDA